MFLSFFGFNTVGVHKARRVAGAFNLPIVGVHHMEAHALVARYFFNVLSFYIQPLTTLNVSSSLDLSFVD